MTDHSEQPVFRAGSLGGSSSAPRRRPGYAAFVFSLLLLAALLCFAVRPASAGFRLILIDTFPHAILDDPKVIAMSPDGAHLYIGDEFRQVVVFSRDAGTGALSLVHEVTTNGDSVDSIAITPDGAHVYVTSTAFGGNITVFSRNATTGELTKLSIFPDQDSGSKIATVSPDGAHVARAGHGACNRGWGSCGR